MNKIKFICAIALILSMVGLTVINIIEGNWRTSALGVLYAA